MDFAFGTVADFITAFSVVYIGALGLYISYGLFKIINLAHGDMVMLGAYLCSVFQSLGWPFVAAVLAAAIGLGAFGLIMEYVVIRRLVGRANLSTLLATWGVSICLGESVRLIFRGDRHVDAPISGILYLGAAPVPVYNIILVCVAIFLGIAMFFLLRRTDVGLLIRATVHSPEAAQHNGVDTLPIAKWMFSLSSALAGFAGALIAPLSAVTPYMGIEFTVNSFLVVITGGMESLAAPVWGASVIGGLRSVFDTGFGVTPSRLAILGLVLLILLIRPYGIASSSKKASF